MGSLVSESFNRSVSQSDRLAPYFPFEDREMLRRNDE